VATLSLVAAELVALAIGTFWIAAALQRQQGYSQRVEQVVAGPLLAPSLELQAPLAQRVLRPLVKRLLGMLGRFSPPRNLEKLRRDLLIAGSPLGLRPLDFVGLRLLTLAVGIPLVMSALAWLAVPFPRSLLLGGAGMLLLVQAPVFWLHRRMRLRRKAILLALPDALDMLTVCVDAGLGLESAFLRVGESWSHGLAKEFERAVTEMGVGMSWREALRNLVYRTDVLELSSLVAVLLQADQMGFSISDTLHAQADQMRVRRRQRAQELARAAPLKMLFPMVFFILPATLAVVIGPAIPAIMAAFSGG
jgi:tight adherence protein C